MSEKKEVLPDHVWNDECAWEWSRFFVGWPIRNDAHDELVKKVAEKVKREVAGAYKAGYKDGLIDGEKCQQISDKEARLIYEEGREKGYEEAQDRYDGRDE